MTNSDKGLVSAGQDRGVAADAAALPPSGLSPCGSQAEPAAANAIDLNLHDHIGDQIELAGEHFVAGRMVIAAHLLREAADKIEPPSASRSADANYTAQLERSIIQERKDHSVRYAEALNAVNHYDALASELLEALKALTNEAWNHMTGGAGHLIDNARAAIAKAESRP